MTDLHKTTEPVCWWNGKFYTCVKNEVGYDIPLYTTPPSVDALIAEAVAKEREACAEMVENLVIFHPGSADRTLDQCAEAIRARGQK